MPIHNDFSIENSTSTTRDSSTSSKRKRDEIRDTYAADIDRRPFTIRTDSTNPFASPRTFTPLCLLPRAQLPLAYLDTAENRLFSADVHALESCYEYGGDASVLIVSENERLYAIERVQRRKYALCRLARSVTTEQVLERATMLLQPLESQRKRQALEPHQTAGQPWWKAAAVEVQPVTTVRTSTMPPLAMRSQAAPEAVQQAGVEEPMPENTGPAQPASLDETLQELARQYLDALYLSRTPLAYFVKGPLARARAAFSSQPAELITFLRGTILTSATMDKKFREVFAEFIKDNSMLDTPGTVSAKPKRKRKWKSKRDKQGLFVDEKDYVEQWWQKLEESAKDHTASNETFEAVLRRRSQVVRNRETLLQVIMIMEVIALEASTPLAPAAPDVTNVPDTETQNQDLKTADIDKKPRKKKEVNMTAILDTLVERLNIYHTLESSPVKTREGENGSAKPDTKDELKTFATEVIIPFFASRIYEVANSTSKKLGGPSAPRPIDKKSTAATTSRKPGEPTIRQPPEKKPRKPLGRTSTDTLNKIGRQPPALQRSITDLDALAPLIKRENSEAPSLSLHNIAAAKDVSKKRTTVLDQYAARHKQIDLSAMSQNFEQKKAKNKNIEDKILRDALNGIRKPNRALATEETAKNADESFARALARSKPSKSQTHRSNAGTREARTVTATPRHIKATPAPRRGAAPQTHNSGELGSGSTAVVPSSSARLRVEPDVVPGSAFAVPQTGHRQRQQKNMLETPSRGFARFMPAGLAREPGTLLGESPTLTRTALREEVTATPMRSLRMPSLAETPIQRRMSPEKTITGVQSSPVAVSSITRDDSGIGLSSSFSAMAERSNNTSKKEVSVYDALGWNDDDYDIA